MGEDGAASPDEAERLDWLRLARAEHVGPIVFHQLIGRYRTAAAALMALPELAARGGRRAAPRVPSRAEAVRELAAAERAGALALLSCEAAYPALLRQIADPPPVLYVAGSAELLQRPAVAVVGARNASAAGLRFAEGLARDLGAAGLVVVSGLARGIDAAAHRGALASGTVAAMAGGIDVVYPPEHEGLAQGIREAGALISEMPPGTRPTARHFPRRNRLVSGLARGIVVVEAAERSGSLITARLALEQDREVFAVPGSPLDPRCRGSNSLIRRGAVLTESAQDVLEVLAPTLAAPRPAAPSPVAPDPEATASAEDAARARLVELLGPTPVEQDELVRLSGLTAPAIMSILLELELAGRLDRHPGNRVSLR